MKLVYLVISHRNPAQVLRLVRALREDGDAAVVVRHDQRHSALGAAELEQAGGRPIEDDIEVEWGGWSFCRMLIASLERVRLELDPDWVMVLSGQDYPLRPSAAIVERLRAAEHDAFLGWAWELETSRMPPPPAEEFFLRYAYRHLRTRRSLPYLPGRIKPLAYVRDQPPSIGIRRLRLPFGRRFRCWVSSDWGTFNRKALAEVLHAARERPRLMRYYRRTPSASESFFATVLMNARHIAVSTDARRYVRIRPGAAHPDVLTAADLPELDASGAEFARKFDADVDARILDLLDERRRSKRPR